jgi:hypothetical protein
MPGLDPLLSGLILWTAHTPLSSFAAWRNAVRWTWIGAGTKHRSMVARAWIDMDYRVEPGNDEITAKNCQ